MLRIEFQGRHVAHLKQRLAVRAHYKVLSYPNQPEAIAVKSIRRLVALSTAEKRLLLHAAANVAFVRLALWFFPFRWICRKVANPGVMNPRWAEISVPQFAWAVRVVARRIPWASCLTQAIALQRLLVQAGRAVTLQIGVANDAARGFEAHAWVECDGLRLPDGDAAAARFKPILVLPYR